MGSLGIQTFAFIFFFLLSILAMFWNISKFSSKWMNSSITSHLVWAITSIIFSKVLKYFSNPIKGVSRPSLVQSNVFEFCLLKIFKIYNVELSAISLHVIVLTSFWVWQMVHLIYHFIPWSITWSLIVFRFHVRLWNELFGPLFITLMSSCLSLLLSFLLLFHQP